MMRPLKLLMYIAVFAVITVSCSDSSDETFVGNWLKKSDFEGVARSGSASFCIGKDAYIGFGIDSKKRMNDFWKYNSETDQWTQIADCPGQARNSAVGFSIDGKGYAGTGYNGDSSLVDFYQYTPESNTWAQIADFKGSARYAATSFSIGSYGYVGTGYDGNYLKDFWRYEPTTNTWTQIASIGGSKRRNAANFVINGIAYVCTGTNNGNYATDFWKFDPSTGVWTELRKIANLSSEAYDDPYAIIRSNAVGFSNQSKGYIATGSNGSLLKDVWEYDPATDIWIKKTAFESTERIDAVSFSLNNRMFIVAGKSSSYQFDDIWEFKPLDTYSEND